MTNSFSPDPYGDMRRDPTGVVAPTDRSADLGDDVSRLASDAGDAGRRVVDVAKDETRSVASETKDQARRLIGQVGDELHSQAAAQQTRVAAGLHSAGAELSEMANSSNRSGYASELVRGAGERADQVARWLEQRDPRGVLDEVKGFARRRPGVFIAIAVGAGILAGRLTRAIAAPPETPADRVDRPIADGGRADFTAPPAPPIREVPPPTATTVGGAPYGASGTGGA